MIKNIFFDFNGTILDDTDLCYDIEAKMIEEEGLPPVSKEFYLDNFCFPVIDYYKKVGFDVSKANYDRISKKFFDSYLERVDSLKKSLLLLERVAKSFYETILKQEEESLSKDKQIEATNKKIKDLLLEMESLKHLNQFLENDNNLLNASKSDMQASYLEEIDSLNNLLQNKKCDSDIDVTKSSVLELDSLYYLGFGFIIVGLILSVIVVIKKNN